MSAYDSYPLGLRLSHLALLRNLDTFGRKPDGEATTMSDDLAAFVRRYVDFLVVTTAARRTISCRRCAATPPAAPPTPRT